MYERLRPLLFRLDAERAHHLGTGAARLVQALCPGLVEPFFGFDDPALAQRVWGLDFSNPVGLAAGFDKNAHLVRFWEALGFGFAEVGSVSARPARGNPRPRAFRLPQDEALVNRMGLNNDGAARVARRLRGRDRSFPVGVNLAKTHDPRLVGEAALDDFRESFRRLAPLADYVALNVSCPNTAEGKTFEEPAALDALLGAVFGERRALGLLAPVLVKLSPPLTTRLALDSLVDELVAVCRQHGVQGLIATNTAADREGLATPGASLDRVGRGGLSGAPLRARATELVRYLYRQTDGRLPIVGVGGVDGPEAAYEKLRAGASLVQLYTGLAYHGPGLVRRIKEGLLPLLERDGFASVREAVGTAA